MLLSSLQSIKPTRIGPSQCLCCTNLLWLNTMCGVHRLSGELLLFFFFLLFRTTSMAYEVPTLGVKLERQLPATAIAMWVPSHVSYPHHSSGQRWILNLLGKAKDRTHVLTVTSQIHFCWATMGTPRIIVFKLQFNTRSNYMAKTLP